MGAEQHAADDWATTLAASVRSMLAGRRMWITVHSIQTVSSDEVQIVFSSPDDATLRGVRLDRQAVAAASERVRTSTLDELAFDVVLLGLEEPRSMGDYGEPDEHGVRWLPMVEWLDP
jgi:hypothetical protein